MRTKTKKYYYTILVLFLLFAGVSNAQYTIVEGAVPDNFSLHQYTTIVDVAGQNLSITEVIENYDTFKPQSLKTDNDDLGFTQNNFWTKTELKNATNVELNYYLETARPITDLVELYIVNLTSGKIKKYVSGDKMDFSQRSFDNRKTIFKITLPAFSSQNLYLHLKSDGEVIKIPIELHSADSFIMMTAKENLFFGIFYGMLLIVALIYFFFFFALKEKIFLFYSLYVLSVGLLQFALDGFFYKYVAPSGGWFSNHSVLFIAIIAVFLSGKYSELFLKIKLQNKSIYRLFQWAYGLLFLLLLCVVFVPSILLFSYIVVNVLTLVFLILIVFSIAYFYRKKIAIDSFFTTGILCLILGFTVFILYNFGLIPASFFTQNSSKLGTGAEVIFLSLSMSNLIRNLKIEKNELNRLALVRSEEMNDLKSYFLSNISHELRTPLNAILNLIDAVSSEVEDEKIKRNCQVIKYSSNSLLSSVNDILDFSKIEKDELKIEKINFNPQTTLGNLKNSAEQRATDKGLEFVFVKPDSLPDCIYGDEMRLIQVVNNVLNNAIKFTSEGFVIFKIEAKQLVDNKVRLLISVSDTGVGIAKEKQDSIFDSFSQNNIDNKRKFGGLGLGLYIVKNLVDMQEGTIHIDSALAKGTRCLISLDYDIVAQENTVAMPVKSVIYDLEGKSILVVEDNPINQMVIKMITKKWLNTTVFYANNGQEGLEVLKSNKIDIVLMDLQMPVMDGYEATVAIRNGEVGDHNKGIPIIALTADVMEGTKLRVSEIGMNHYLSKPITKELLYQVVKELA
jgi:signal transduction histidine kinase/CheY-like chemotaxis protein